MKTLLFTLLALALSAQAKPVEVKKGHPKEESSFSKTHTPTVAGAGKSAVSKS